MNEHKPNKQPFIGNENTLNKNSLYIEFLLVVDCPSVQILAANDVEAAISEQGCNFF